MIDINLLPPEYGPKKLINLFNLAGIFIFSLICLSLVFCSLKLVAAVQDYSSRVEYNDEQIKLYTRQVEDIHELGEKVKLLKVRLSMVKELLQEKTTWSDKLAELFYYLPYEGIWIDALVVEREDPTQINKASGTTEEVEAEKVMVNISGYAVSVDKVSEFVGNLEESKTFGNIVFDSTTSNPQQFGNESFMSFRFKVQVLN